MVSLQSYFSKGVIIQLISIWKPLRSALKRGARPRDDPSDLAAAVDMHNEFGVSNERLFSSIQRNISSSLA